MRSRRLASAVLLAGLLGGCGRGAESVRTGGLDARTVARVEQVRLSLLPAVEARDALAADNASLRADNARLTAELERARQVAPARSTASRGVRRLSAASGDCSQWTALLAAYPWPVGTMAVIMRCESKCDPNARNPSGANGLLQVIGGPMDPAANIAAGYRLYSSSDGHGGIRGLHPWDSSRSCWG